MKTIFFTCFLLNSQLLLSSAYSIQLPDPIPRFHSSFPGTPHIIALLPSKQQDLAQSGAVNSQPILNKKRNHQLSSDPSDPTKTKIILGYLPDVAGHMSSRQGVAVSGAMSFAVNQINQNSALLPNVELAFIYNDTHGLADSTNKIILDDLANQDAAAFIGPEGPNCQGSAELAFQANRAMISFHCTDLALPNMTKYPTFIRMDPSSSQLASKAIEVLGRQGQTDYVILVEKSEELEWQHIGRELERQGGLSVAGYVEFDDYEECCMEELPCCDKLWPVRVMEKTQYISHNYVFIGKPDNLVQFNEVMSKAGLFDQATVSILYLSPTDLRHEDLMPLLWSKGQSFYVNSCQEMSNYETMLQAWKSLTVITKAASFRGPDSFNDMVRKYNHLPPFNFPNPSLIFRSKPAVYISMTATHLFDSVVVYAKALHNLMQQASATGEDVSIENLAKDGRRITQAILDSGGYQSVSGTFVPFDQNGDSRGEFKTFRLKNTFFSRTSKVFGNTFTCPHYLMEDEESPEHFSSSKNVIAFEKRTKESPGMEGNNVPAFLETKPNSILPDKGFSNYKYYSYGISNIRK